MIYFGNAWGNVPLVRCGIRVPPPVGAPCLGCDELVAEQDSGCVVPCLGLEDPRGTVGAPYHRECFLRSVVGSVGHQRKQCSCYGGTEEDPEGMTRRQAAQAAMDHYFANVGRRSAAPAERPS